MPVDPCEERHSLSLRVYVAVEALYEAKERYESAKERKAAHVSELRKLLNEVRTAELERATALREHIESHGCLH
jgi:hypothetical protein